MRRFSVFKLDHYPSGGFMPSELPVGSLLNRSIPEAVKLYLRTVKKKLPTGKIAQALEEAGVESTSDNFSAVVNASLTRLKKAGEVLRFSDGWALAEFYPKHLRAANTSKKLSGPTTKKRQTKKAAGGGKKKTAMTGQKASAEPIKASAPPTETSAKQGLEAEIRGLILANPGRSYRAADLAKTVERKVQVISLVLGKLAHKGIISRVGNGGYQASKGGQLH
jgi:hypothetical protein